MKNTFFMSLLVITTAMDTIADLITISGYFN